MALTIMRAIIIITVIIYITIITMKERGHLDWGEGQDSGDRSGDSDLNQSEMEPRGSPSWVRSPMLLPWRRGQGSRLRPATRVLGQLYTVIWGVRKRHLGTSGGSFL